MSVSLVTGGAGFIGYHVAAELLKLGYTVVVLDGLSGGFVENIPSGVQINKAHFDLLRPGGLAFISVPNKFFPPYRVFKFAAEVLRIWKVGEEYPYSRAELRRICEQIGVRDYGFFGDDFRQSLHFISPLHVARRLLKRRPDYSIARLKQEIGTRLDAYLAYALILYGKK
jgi:hypothetical protein